jgi:transcriptional regulator with XRE-family HTH domain
MGAAREEPPAVARQRVRRALRKARQATGLVQGDVAQRLNWSQSKVQRIESGAVGVSVTDLRALLGVYGIRDEALIEQLVKDAAISRRQRWSVPAEHREHLTSGLRQLLQFED